MIDGELGAFLRSRRESRQPTDVGLHTTQPRRTPGLRREELATLAGISIDYLIRLEQGRDTRPSTQVLAALADALLLSDADRQYLHDLAVISNGTQLCPQARPTAALNVRPTVRSLLDRLDPTPAVVLNHLSDLLAWNNSYDRLMRPLGLLDETSPNLTRFVLADQRAHTAYPDWHHEADTLVAALHQLRRGDPATDTFATQLSHAAGTEFDRRWQRRPVRNTRTTTTRLHHPEVGTLHLAVPGHDVGDTRLIGGRPRQAVCGRA